MTTQKRLQRLNRARRLLANGVPLNIDRHDENAGLLMRQIGAVAESRAFDLKDGRSGYIVNIRITITQGAFAVAGFALELPWADGGLLLVEDPLESGARYNNYWFPGNDTLAFDRTAVINHFANVRRLLRRGKTIEGLLLWVGSEPIPEAFVHGVLFPASLIVFDQYGNSFPAEVDLWADRSEREARDNRTRKSRPRLFSEPDPSPAHSRPVRRTFGVGVAGGGSR